MNPQQTAQHQWLQKFVGEWTYETEAHVIPGEPPMKFTGTESVRSIGGLWIQGEGKGTMPDGGPATMLITLGYDPNKGKFVGTFIASMMTYLWQYNDGTLDGNVLTLPTVGPADCGDPSSTGSKMANFRERVEFKSDDHRIFSSAIEGPDGEWKPVMTAHYRRVK